MADKDLSESGDVRRLTPAELRKLTKDQLQFALRTLINEPAEETAAGPGMVQMGRIESKLDDLLTKWDKEKEALQNQIKELRRDRDNMAETLSQHQRMLESIEADRRAANIIMTGVPEEQKLGDAATDIEKVKLVLSTIGQQAVEVKSVERLGAQRQDRRTPTGDSRPYRRPIKVILKDADNRKAVLDNTNKLKNDDIFKFIYVKKDVHPIVRKELDRLRAVTKREKERPENQGKTVRYDYKERKVYVNDVVIDSFQNVTL